MVEGETSRCDVYADSIHSSAVMIVRGGTVINECGDVDKKIDSSSARKSFITSLYGIYSADGVIDVNQTLEQIDIDDPPDPLTKAETETGARCRFAARAFRRLSRCRFRNRVDEEKPSRARHPPTGAYWYYNNSDFNVVGAIFEKKTGMKIGDAFYQRIAVISCSSSSFR